MEPGWCTSIPGAPEVTIEALPGSTLPADLRGIGYNITETGTTERILPNAVVEMVLTEGSTVPIKMVHAGICKVKRFSFSL